MEKASVHNELHLPSSDPWTPSLSPGFRVSISSSCTLAPPLPTMEILPPRASGSLNCQVWETLFLSLSLAPYVGSFTPPPYNPMGEIVNPFYKRRGRVSGWWGDQPGSHSWEEVRPESDPRPLAPKALVTKCALRVTLQCWPYWPPSSQTSPPPPVFTHSPLLLSCTSFSATSN